jgi:hypothetical protein
MRINILGESAPAKALRGLLRRHDFHLSEHHADWTIHIDESETAGAPVMDSVSCELEAGILRHLRKLTPTPVVLQTAGGIQHDRAVRIVVPSIDTERRAVEIAVFRALLELSTPVRRNWWARWFKPRGENETILDNHCDGLRIVTAAHNSRSFGACLRTIATVRRTGSERERVANRYMEPE